MPRTPEKQQFVGEVMQLALARLRAWGEQGVAVEGRWESRWIAGQSGPNSVSAALRPSLEIECGTCQARGFGAYEEAMEEDASLTVGQVVRAIERAAIGRLRCEHCKRALEPEPEAFDTLAQMLALEKPGQ